MLVFQELANLLVDTKSFHFAVPLVLTIILYGAKNATSDNYTRAVHRNQLFVASNAVSDPVSDIKLRGMSG